MTIMVTAGDQPARKKSPDLAMRMLVFPVLSSMGLVPHGEIVHCEGTSQDKRAGLDWLISASDGTQSGIASRVQWGTDYGTFSIRYRTEKGQMSELTKRYRSVVGGAQYPTLTIQAYVDPVSWTLLNAYVVRTDDLYRHVIHLGHTSDDFLLCNCATRPRWAPGGAQFIPVAITEEGRQNIGAKATLLGHGVPVAMIRQRTVGMGMGL
jgi:hypothetical protein